MTEARLFDRVGGAPFFERLVDRFYAGVATDPALLAVYPDHGTSGAKSGDLYLRVRLAPHPKFEAKGKDLYTRVSVPLTTAALSRVSIPPPSTLTPITTAPLKIS